LFDPLAPVDLAVAGVAEVVPGDAMAPSAGEREGPRDDRLGLERGRLGSGHLGLHHRGEVLFHVDLVDELEPSAGHRDPQHARVATDLSLHSTVMSPWPGDDAALGLADLELAKAGRYLRW